jgi:cell division protein ZapE
LKTIEYYQQELKARGYQSDPAQLRAVERLQKCEDEWIAYKGIRSSNLKKKLFKPTLPRGLYLWGGVGRGKSFLMDCFYAASPLEKKIRIHFHEFMREVHRELHELSGLAID